MVNSYLGWSKVMWNFRGCNSENINIKVVIRKNTKVEGCNSQLIGVRFLISLFSLLQL